MNTYDTSEYLAKAKLAIADSWFREGGCHGLAQAEAEYKDFILFYPDDGRIGRGAGKGLHDPLQADGEGGPRSQHALRAEDECRQLLTQFPNSKFAPEAQQKLRDIQEVLAEHEFRVGILLPLTRAAFRPPPTGCRAWRISSRCSARPTKRSGNWATPTRKWALASTTRKPRRWPAS